MPGNHDYSASLPLITIAITCYNAEDTIRRAVLSAIRQTWPNREILILDDCSTDRSWTIIQGLMKQFPELRAMRHRDNRGVAAAYNTLLYAARGEFIAYFDDDDESATHRIEAQYERIAAYETAHPSCFVLCFSHRHDVPPGGAPVIQKLGIGHSAPEPYGSIVADYFLGLGKSGPFCWGSAGSAVLMARTATIRMIGGADAEFKRATDTELWVRAALKGAHFISVDVPLLRRYITEGSEKAGNVNHQYQRMKLRKYKDYLKSKRCYWGAVANLHAASEHTKGRHRRGHVWRALALLLFPWWVSRQRILNRPRPQRVIAIGRITSRR
jgi:glycosyltransferase involved in cell wall biosynthesis